MKDLMSVEDDSEELIMGKQIPENYSQIPGGKPKKISIKVINSLQSVNKSINILQTQTMGQLFDKLKAKKMITKKANHLPSSMEHYSRENVFICEYICDLDGDFLQKTLTEFQIKNEDTLSLKYDILSSSFNACEKNIAENSKKTTIFTKLKNSIRSSKSSILSDVFGCSLETLAEVGPPLMSDELFGIPNFIIAAMEFIKDKCNTTEGIFRLSGSASCIRSLMEKINARQIVEFEKISDAHNAAGIIKAFLRELPEPLITMRLFDGFYLASLLEDDFRLQASVFSILFLSLPKSHQNLLMYTCSSFLHLLQFEEYTKMDIMNFATLLGPNITWPYPLKNLEQAQLFEISSKSSSIALFLLKHGSAIFFQKSEYSQFIGIANFRDSNVKDHVFFIENVDGLHLSGIAYPFGKTKGIRIEKQTIDSPNIEVIFIDRSRIKSHMSSRPSSPLQSSPGICHESDISDENLMESLRIESDHNINASLSSPEGAPPSEHFTGEQISEICAENTLPHNVFKSKSPSETEYVDRNDDVVNNAVDRISIPSNYSHGDLVDEQVETYTLTEQMHFLHYEISELKSELESEKQERLELSNLVSSLMKNQNDILTLLQEMKSFKDVKE